MAKTATQQITGASRVRGPMVVTLTGAGSKGHDPLTVGAGFDPAFSLHVPTAQTAGCFQIEQPAGTLIGGLSVARVALTAAQLIAMGTTAVSILPAPGAGLAIVPVSIVFIMKRTATAFTSGGVISFIYHTTTSSVAHAGTIAASVLTTASAATTLTMLGPNTSATGTPIPANEGIDITNATAAFATGTGTAVVLITYSIVTAS